MPDRTTYMLPHKTVHINTNYAHFFFTLLPKKNYVCKLGMQIGVYGINNRIERMIKKKKIMSTF